MTTTTIVSGLGRCGTSMLMQMLHRGGMPCVGPWPSFEVDEARATLAPEFVAANAGKAIKVLDPQRTGLPDGVRVVWLDRDHRQQAKSHAKFLEILTGNVYDRAGRRALAASLARDTAAALRLIGPRPLLRMRFEDVLREPLMAAVQLRRFIDAEDFDVTAAALAVRYRSPACEPGLGLELSLMEGA